MSKLIESLIKPSKTASRTVNVHNTPYEFTEVTKGRFVAKVDDPAAIAVFLGRTKDYREFTDAIAGSPTLARTAPAPAPVVDPPKIDPPKVDPPVVDPPAPPAPEGDGKTGPADGSSTAGEDEAAAQALLSSTPTAIKKQLEKHCPSKAVLEAALKIEKSSAKKRDHVIACLTGALSSLDA